MDFTGRPLRGFVYVAPSGVTTDDALGEWIAKDLAFTERGDAPKKSRRAGKRPRPRSKQKL
jgi:hypothetical protein